MLLPVQLPLHLLHGPAGEGGVKSRAWFLYADLGKLFTIQMERRGDRAKKDRRIEMIKLVDRCLGEVNWYLYWWGCYC